MQKTKTQWIVHLLFSCLKTMAVVLIFLSILNKLNYQICQTLPLSLSLWGFECSLKRSTFRVPSQSGNISKSDISQNTQCKALQRDLRIKVTLQCRIFISIFKHHRHTLSLSYHLSAHVSREMAIKKDAIYWHCVVTQGDERPQQGKVIIDNEECWQKALSLPLLDVCSRQSRKERIINTELHLSLVIILHWCVTWSCLAAQWVQWTFCLWGQTRDPGLLVTGQMLT